jgi:hypothetical protein
VTEHDSEDTAEEQTPEQRRALFRVVRGEPDDHELAALTAVLAAAASAGAAAAGDKPARRGAWLDRHAQLRRPLHPGPHAWKNSTLPR